MAENLFEKVKARASVTEIVSHFATLHFNHSGFALCPFHNEKTPSFSINKSNNSWKCFGCGVGGDAIDFVAMLKGVNTLEAAKLIAAEFNIIDDYTPKKSIKKDRGTMNKIDIKKYIEECIKHTSETDYFKTRGLSAETVKKYSLGYDPKEKRIIIPYSQNKDYYCARSTVLKHNEPFFIMKPKTEIAGEEPLFYKDALYGKSQFVFVVESQICTLSLFQCNAAAIAINGTSGVNKLFKQLKIKKPIVTLIICLDNDEAGKKASQEICNELYELNIKFIEYHIAGECKDPNELLVKNCDALIDNITKAKIAAKKKYQTDKDSFSAAELQKTTMKEPEWLVKDMLPEGLAILSAPSKAGKSWMVLQMCLAITQGKDYIGFKTVKTGCLYYALEDSKRRLKDRINKVLNGEAASDMLHLAIKSDPLDEGLLEQIESELRLYPEIRLVVIDTLQKVRGRNEKSESMYSSDYREMAKFKEFADSKNICIFLVHHVRKMKDESDVFNSISGSNGIMGACDTVFIISKKNRNDENAIFSMTGRDIKQEEYVIMFNKSDYTWERVGTSEEIEQCKKKQEYENSPFVKTIKTMVNKSPLGWKATTQDFLNAVFDVTNEQIVESGNSLSRLIKEIESQLYYDGIEHKTSRTGSNRYHEFKKKSGYSTGCQQNISDIKSDD